MTCSNTILVGRVRELQLTATDENRWTKISVEGEKPIPRALMTGQLVGTDIYYFAGIKGHGGYAYYLNDLIKFHTSTFPQNSSDNLQKQILGHLILFIRILLLLELSMPQSY